MTWLESPISPGVFVTAMTAVVVVLSMLKAWLTARQELQWVFWIMIVAPALHFSTTVVVAMKSPEMAGVLIYGVMSLWTIAMGAYGLWGLHQAMRQVRERIDALASRGEKPPCR